MGRMLGAVKKIISFYKEIKTTYLIAHMVVLLIIIISTLHTTFAHKPDPMLDENSIDEYANNVQIEDAIGQILMVGLPSDYNNYKDSKESNSIIKEIGAGSVILNTYNFYNPKNKYENTTYLGAIIDFINAIQDKALDANLSLPLLISTDFEGPNYTSIKYGLTLPPSALSIGSTNDAKIISSLGRFTGEELKNIGIDIILGPVLDTYNIKQNSTTIQDRCFSSTVRGVISTSSHFIKGLKEANIAVFAKHFPSYGSVEENPHSNVTPQYSGSIERLSNDIKPFKALSGMIDGIMTSHIYIKSLKTPDVATFSKDFISEQIKQNFSEQIVITDDLSDMGSIDRYRNDNNATYESIAIKAFDSGHDMLLFSHVGRDSKFKLNDLRNVRKALLLHIENDSKFEKQFRDSLKKIIKLKLKLSRKPFEKISKFLNNKDDKESYYRVNLSGNKVLENSQSFLRILNDNDISSSEKLIKTALRKSTIKISNKISYKLSDYPDKKICFCIPQEHQDKFTSIFSSNSNYSFLTVPETKGSKQFSEFKNKLINVFENVDLLIYIVNDKSDADALKSIQLRFNSFNRKTVIFCHTTPSIFDNEILAESTIIGNFTNHPFSYLIDIEVLTGNSDPSGIENLPISIGDNGKFHSADDIELLPQSDITRPIDINTTPFACENEFEKNIRKQYFLVRKSVPENYIFISFSIFILCSSYILYIKFKSSDDNIICSNPFMCTLIYFTIVTSFFVLLALVAYNIDMAIVILGKIVDAMHPKP